MFDNVNGARLASKRVQQFYNVKASLAAEIVARAAGWPDWYGLEKGLDTTARPSSPHASFERFVADRLPQADTGVLLLDIRPARPREVVTNHSYRELLDLIDDTTTARPPEDVLKRNRHLVVMSCGIIDWWQGMVPLRRIDPEQLSNGDYLEQYDESDGPRHMRTFRTEVYEMLLVGRWLASHVLFEGDISVGPYLSSTPSLDGISVAATNMLGWKQHNNGSSFVVMDGPMPHLIEDPTTQYSMTEYAWLADGEVVTSPRCPF